MRSDIERMRQRLRDVERSMERSDVGEEVFYYNGGSTRAVLRGTPEQRKRLREFIVKYHKQQKTERDGERRG